MVLCTVFLDVGVDIYLTCSRFSPILAVCPLQWPGEWLVSLRLVRLQTLPAA